MEVFRRLIGVIASASLAITFVAAGFLVCLAPPVTPVLSSTFAKDDLSPFDRTQLVKVAQATRDFSFGRHSELELYQVIYDVDDEYRQGLAARDGKVDAGFPPLDQVVDRGDLGQMRAVFAHASELYCYSPETIAHLDDCNVIARSAYPALAVAAVFAIGGAVLVGMLGRKRRLGNVFMAAGCVVIAAFVGLGLWAAVDFTGFFTSFHQLFFAQGSWVFPYDSLLICALPTEFWMGMGAVWLAVSIIISILSIVIGARLRKQR